MNKYDESDIQLLEGLDGVRQRPAMYIKSTGEEGLHHLVWEIVDNSVDEALNGYGSNIKVTINKDDSITVSDEGRGIPCGMHPKAKISTIELILTTLHSGGKFNENAYSKSAGLHGVGTSVTNALSDFLDATVYRDGKIYHIRFEDGGRKKTVPLEVLGNTNKHGTTITFKPSKKYFKTTDFKFDIISQRLQEEAFLLKNVHFFIKDERTGASADYIYENGITEYVSYINRNREVVTENPIYFEDSVDVADGKGGTSQIKVEIAMQYAKNYYDENLRSYVNNVHTVNGGTHETGFRSGLTRAVNDFAESNKLFKNKQKFEATDIREGLTTIISIKMGESNLEFEGQTKGSINTASLATIVANVVYEKFSYYLNENKAFSIYLMDKCNESQRIRIAARKFKEESRKAKKIKSDYVLSDKLVSATSKDYKNNELFIVEGDSAGGSAKKGRDHMHQAILPLRGKPLNVESLRPEEAIKNTEIRTLITTIGAGYGKDFDVEDSHYGKIIIMTDADVDGSHIQTLLLTFFYRYMKPLIENGMVYVAMPPLYRVYKNTGKKNYNRYCWSDDELEEAKVEAGAGYKINRYKGLGEMNADQLKITTMNKETRKLIQVRIEDAIVVENRISTLMGNDVESRKKWLEENVDYSVRDDFKEKR